MKETRITIVGMGPRGLSVLERMLEHAHSLQAPAKLTIDIVDPNECGQGSHPSAQPEHLLINTVASQVTMFAPVSVAGGEHGPSLVDWAQASGYRRVGNRFVRTSDGSGAAITPFDYLPRFLLGEYLSWVFHRIVARLPASFSIRHRRSRVVDLAPGAAGFDVKLQDGSAYRTDYVFLTTGHGFRKFTAEDARHAEFAGRRAADNARLAYFASAYPIDALSRITADSTVAVQGLGLTAHDVISALTLGRGGSYVERDGRLQYVRSGTEPRILLFSRTCLPFAARGVNQKGLTGRHQAQFFTPEAVARIRSATLKKTGDPRIDFRADVLPLVIKEMAYAYRAAALGQHIAPGSFEPSATEERAVHAILWPLTGRAFASLAAFRDFFDGWVREDFAEAHKGNLTSPVKAATDVLRDTREAFRAAVEYSGLTPESHRFFINDFNAAVNRVSFGPPRQRIAEFLALRDAGLIDIAGGPGACVSADEQHARFKIEAPYATHTDPTHVDVLIVARLDAYSPLSDDSPLTANLAARGLVRPYCNGDYHPSGIDIDTNLHPVGVQGDVQRRIWAIGFLVEGQHYYTHALPRPMIASRQTKDAERCVLELFEAITSSAGNCIPAAG
jgi:uncharacterized NAD(P)/FAD-binding protein YdhS